MLSADEAITQYIPARQVRALLDVSNYVGDAPARARGLVKEIRETLAVQASVRGEPD